MDEWTTCADCGFSCLKSQLSKTRGKCPRCNKTEAENFLKRREHFKNGGRLDNMPQEIK